MRLMSEKQPLFAQEYPVKEPFVVKNCFGNDIYTPPVNPFADLQDSLEQQQATETKNQKIKEPIKFAGPDAPIWSTKHPQRAGPLLWWQKDPDNLDPVTAWHREHPLSPDFKAPDIDNRRKKDDAGPRKPSYGRSAEWYVEKD